MDERDSEPLLKNVSMTEIRKRLWWTRKESLDIDHEHRTILLYFQDLRVKCLMRRNTQMWEMLAEIVHAPDAQAQGIAIDAAWRWIHEGEE